uniref:Kinetochore protein Spc24 n=1 Tax=Ditylum brightwellii TaxID=49249 RepID=A0A7S1YQV0_9STRA
MAKRKGSDFAASPPTAVITSLDTVSTCSPITSGLTPLTASSLFTSPQTSPTVHQTEEEEAWEESKDLMAKLIEHFDGPDADDDAALVKESMLLVENLKIGSQRNAEEAASVKHHIQRQIKEEEDACRREGEDLAKQNCHIAALEEEIRNLKIINDEVDQQKKESEQRTERYRAEASVEVEKIDEVEAAKIKEVPRMKKQLSLYAAMTNIKWHYEKENVMAGEVAVLSQGICRRFEIDPMEHSEFDVANAVWSLMDGKSSAVVSC